MSELDNFCDSSFYDGGFDGGCLLMGEGSILGSGVYYRLFRFGVFCLLSLKCVVYFGGFCVFWVMFCGGCCFF